MSISSYQLRELIIKPALFAIGLYSENATELMMLTAATETGLGTFLRQQNVPNNIGAYGIYQMETMAYDDIWDKVILPNQPLRLKMKLYLQYDNKPTVQRLISDLALCSITARLYYHRVKEPLPMYTDIHGMAAYYKKYWNTDKGSNTPEKAVNDYMRYVK